MFAGVGELARHGGARRLRRGRRLLRRGARLRRPLRGADRAAGRGRRRRRAVTTPTTGVVAPDELAFVHRRSAWRAPAARATASPSSCRTRALARVHCAATHERSSVAVRTRRVARARPLLLHRRRRRRGGRRRPASRRRGLRRPGAASRLPHHGDLRDAPQRGLRGRLRRARRAHGRGRLARRRPARLQVRPPGRARPDVGRRALPHRGAAHARAHAERAQLPAARHRRVAVDGVHRRHALRRRGRADRPRRRGAQPRDGGAAAREPLRDAAAARRRGHRRARVTAPAPCAGRRSRSVAWTTIGIERRSNAKLQIADRDAFVEAAGGVGERPPYFRRVEVLNLEGAPLPHGAAGAAAAHAAGVRRGGAGRGRRRHALGDGLRGGARARLDLAVGRRPAAVRRLAARVRAAHPARHRRRRPDEAARRLVRLGYDDIAGFLVGRHVGVAHGGPRERPHRDRHRGRALRVGSTPATGPRCSTSARTGEVASAGAIEGALRIPLGELRRPPRRGAAPAAGSACSAAAACGR